LSMKPKKPSKRDLQAVMSALGKRGGPARWRGVTPEERKRLMSQAAKKRWAKRQKKS